MPDRIKKDEFVRRLAARMHTDETTATTWVDGVVETLYESFTAGERVTLPGFGGFYVRPAPASWAFKFNPVQRLRALFGLSSTYRGERYMPGGVGERSGNGASRRSTWPIVLLQSGKLFSTFERESHMAKKQKRWIYSPRKPVPPRIPEEMHMEVTKKANELIDTWLKPNYLQPPPENPQFNYIIDIYGKWYRSYFYFCSTYYCPGPNAISPTFEVRFTRLHYAGNGRFNLAYMRYTGQWWEVYRSVSLDECLARIREEPLFHP